MYSIPSTFVLGFLQMLLVFLLVLGSGAQYAKLTRKLKIEDGKAFIGSVLPLRNSQINPMLLSFILCNFEVTTMHDAAAQSLLNL